MGATFIFIKLLIKGYVSYNENEKSIFPRARGAFGTHLHLTCYSCEIHFFCVLKLKKKPVKLNIT